ncbi:hypothetical protein [Mesorhizobium abyssinicae]|uniref:hypothetical protein n=1 Tax=Mesorhizobium abyssinicae TaxID=1209958 RepID=UPI003CFA56B7
MSRRPKARPEKQKPRRSIRGAARPPNAPIAGPNNPALLAVQLWCQQQMTHSETPACVGPGGKSCAGQAWHGSCCHNFSHAGRKDLFHIDTGI